jgi:hypothetical protein
VAKFLAAEEVQVERMTKQGKRAFDTRQAVTYFAVTQQSDAPSEAMAARCAIIDLVVRQVTPAVRPDDVLSGLRVVAGLEPPVPPRATRLAQGRLVLGTFTPQGEIVDPLAADREDATIGGH